MYSKDRGFTYSPAGTAAPHPSSRSPRVSVPPNYSGHAIVDGEERPLGILREEPQGGEERADIPTPRFDSLPRVSDLGGGPRHPPRTVTASFSTGEALPVLSEASAAPASVSAVSDGGREEGTAPEKKNPLTATPFRFLSGQGLGLEELLLLGLILFLLRESGEEDRGDLDETVILLGLLLLFG